MCLPLLSHECVLRDGLYQAYPAFCTASDKSWGECLGMRLSTPYISVKDYTLSHQRCTKVGMHSRASVAELLLFFLLVPGKQRMANQGGM